MNNTTELNNFEAAYKLIKGHGDLKWISCHAATHKEADALMDEYMKRIHKFEYRRYAGALPIKHKLV